MLKAASQSFLRSGKVSLDLVFHHYSNVSWTAVPILLIISSFFPTIYSFITFIDFIRHIYMKMFEVRKTALQIF